MVKWATRSRVAMLIVVAVAATAAPALRGATSSYNAQSRGAKRDYLWSNILADTTSHPWPSLLAKAHLFIESMQPTVSYVGDEMPSGRSKLIHSVGAVAKAQLFWNGAGNYTGIFQGADTVIIRYSSALEPDTSKVDDPANSNFIPAMAFKVLRDGVPSANWMAMHNLYAQDSWNPFAYPFSNHLSDKNLDLPTKALGVKFKTASAWPFFVGLSDAASYTQDGDKVLDPIYPYQLIYVPDYHVSGMFGDSYTNYFTDQLMSIPAGSTLYSIQAKYSPSAHPVTIGRVVLQSRFTTSDYGDNTYFHKHQIFEEDLAMAHAQKVRWTDECPSVDACPICPVDIPCY